MAYDEFSADAFTRGVLNPGSSVRSAIDYYGDVDWFRTTLQAGLDYRFTTFGFDETVYLRQGGTYDPETLLSHPRVALYHDGAKVAEAIGGGSFFFFGVEFLDLRYEARETGTYFVEIASRDPSDLGSYDLGLSIFDPDSFFGWRFVANGGDMYGGHLYDDSKKYAVGQSWRTAFGRYEITSESEYGYDLSSSKRIEEGTTFTTWYFDADTGRTLTTNSNGNYPTSRTGPGAEYDYVWTGTTWDDFGGGGYHQADADLPDSFFAWRFVATSGDTYGGHLFDDSRDYAVGSSWTTAQGRYEIFQEQEYGRDLGADMAEGATYTTWYADAASGRTLTTYSNGSYATSRSGPGTEYDHAWTGSGWDDFGHGGYHQADGDLPDSFFAWRFVADSGDVYGGHFFDDSRDHAVGDSWTTAQGRYEVFQEYEYGFDISGPYGIAEGATYTTWYQDAVLGLVPRTYSGGAYATGTAGPGSEFDYADTAIGWDDFGLGGSLQVGPIA